MKALEINDLTVRSEAYPIVEGLNLSADEGETVVINGPSPLSRQLLRVIGGLTAPARGSVLIYGQPARYALIRGLVQLIEGPHGTEPVSICPVLLLWNFPVPTVIPPQQVLVIAPPFIKSDLITIGNVNKWINVKAV